MKSTKNAEFIFKNVIFGMVKLDILDVYRSN